MPYYRDKYHIWDKINGILSAADGLEVVAIKWKKKGIWHQYPRPLVLPFIRHMILRKPFKATIALEPLWPHFHIRDLLFQVGHN